MKEIKLKPWPFCGGEVKLFWWDSEEQNSKIWEECDDDIGATFPSVECLKCDHIITFGGLGYGKEVIKAWNRRSDNE